MVTLQGLTKAFGKFIAVDRLTLEVKDGEIYGLLGPNGAGKTTTFRMVAGLLKPTSGTSFIGGYDILKNPIEAKMIMGFLPDRPFLYEKLTGVEFLDFIVGLYGMDGSLAQRRIADLLEAFELAEWGGELIESYSHGMKQRLIIASALLHQPKVLVVDEPMVGLDPKGAILIKKLLKKMKAEGLTIFMSTHTLSVAEELCDRIGIIHEGKLIAEGTLEELKKLAHEKDFSSVFLKLTGGEDIDKTVKTLFPLPNRERVG